EGTTSGTQTDFDGNYAIKAEKGSVLVFSYIGMLSKSVSVSDKNVIDITLEENAATLEEVVIVGYGSQKKEALTGAVSVVKGVELEQAPTSTF
ncbi:carboxypeptidase-like regulatory domain-containing protein, partial [Aquimarina celericrescens]|nr:carboxypeptidase-like regulatory domain-containing protein [Aquimarina celericrescens]